MDISTQDYEKVSVMAVSGRVDSATAPELESEPDSCYLASAKLGV